jgi:dTDP-4-dehydrorhamnose reductase
VFDGSGDDPFAEDNIKNLNPLNFYGKTKLAAERAIIGSRCNYLILRTSWVYDESGKNFVNTIKKLAQEKDEMSVVCDQVGSPTSARFIAKNTFKIIEKLTAKDAIFPSGIYHLTEAKNISWYDFAVEIIEELKAKGKIVKIKKIIPIKTSKYQSLAARPLNSRLDCKKIKNVLDGKIDEFIKSNLIEKK